MFCRMKDESLGMSDRSIEVESRIGSDRGSVHYRGVSTAMATLAPALSGATPGHQRQAPPAETGGASCCSCLVATRAAEPALGALAR